LPSGNGDHRGELIRARYEREESGMRTGEQYLAALRDDRAIFVDGERVADVTEHEAFRGIVSTVASLYDIAADPANDMSFTEPTTGLRANKIYMIPRNVDDLRARRAAIERWARASNGLLGRGPDHVAAFLAAFASAPSVFENGRAGFGDNLTAFYRRALADDLYLSYVIIPPQVDRSKTAQGQEEAFLQVGVLKEQDGGIVVRGAQMLGTAAAISDYIFVSCIMPQRPGDEDYALSFVVPLAASGLRLYPRRPYAMGQPSTFDYPLSTRFDETDALVVFDDVFIPWEHVFVYRDVELTRKQFFETAAHVLGNTQAQIRLAVKLQFLAGVARKIAATNRIDVLPQVQETLADLAAIAAIVEGMVLAAEGTSSVDAYGVARPNPRFLYAAMSQQAEFYPRALHLLRMLAGGGVMQLPSSAAELNDPRSGPDIRRYIRSTGVPSEERIKLFKLAWDLFGSEFGSRHHQYEMFYAGAPYVAKGYAFRNYGFDAAVKLVDDFMSTYRLEPAAVAQGSRG
jgi:4-hydroxyphenylacetate 3-monooxygenase